MVEIATLIKKHLQTYRVIHFAIVMGSVTYGIVIFMIYNYTPISPKMQDLSVLSTLEYASIPYVISAFFFAKFLRSRGLDSTSIFMNKETSKTDKDKPVFLDNYLTLLFIVWAILETISIIGIVLFFMSAQIMIPLVLIAIAVFLKIANGPSLEELNKLSKKYESISMEGV